MAAVHVLPSAPRMIPWASILPHHECTLHEGKFGVVLRGKLQGSKPQPIDVAVKLVKTPGEHDSNTFQHTMDAVKREVDAHLWASTGARAIDEDDEDRFIVKPLGILEGALPDVWRAAVPLRLVRQLEMQRSSSDDIVVIGIVMRWLPLNLHQALHPPHNQLNWCNTATTTAKLKLLVQIANGLYALHRGAKTVVHGDLKPENILLTDTLFASGCSVRLCDFGLSSLKEQDTHLSSVRHVTEMKGTYAYMAPEQCPDWSQAAPEGGLPAPVAIADVGCSTDMYAFGVLCWEIMTGQVPWKGHTPDHMARLKHLGHCLHHDLPRDLGENVRHLIRSCQAKDREQRPRIEQARCILEAAYHEALRDQYDVFISYCWGINDFRQPLAIEVYNLLRTANLRVWMDIDRGAMSDNLRDSMRGAITRSQVVLVLASPEYVNSRSCGYEMEEMLSQGKRCIVANVHSEPLFSWCTGQLRDTDFWTKIVDHQNKKFVCLSKAAQLPVTMKDYVQTLGSVLNEPLLVPELVNILRSAIDRVCSGSSTEVSQSERRVSGTDSTEEPSNSAAVSDQPAIAPAESPPEAYVHFERDINWGYKHTLVVRRAASFPPLEYWLLPKGAARDEMLEPLLDKDPDLNKPDTDDHRLFAYRTSLDADGFVAETSNNRVTSATHLRCLGYSPSVRHRCPNSAESLSAPGMQKRKYGDFYSYLCSDHQHLRPFLHPYDVLCDILGRDGDIYDVPGYEIEKSDGITVVHLYRDDEHIDAEDTCAIDFLDIRPHMSPALHADQCYASTADGQCWRQADHAAGQHFCIIHTERRHNILWRQWVHTLEYFHPGEGAALGLVMEDKPIPGFVTIHESNERLKGRVVTFVCKDGDATRESFMDTRNTACSMFCSTLQCRARHSSEEGTQCFAAPRNGKFFCRDHSGLDYKYEAWMSARAKVDWFEAYSDLRVPDRNRDELFDRNPDLVKNARSCGLDTSAEDVEWTDEERASPSFTQAPHVPGYKIEGSEDDITWITYTTSTDTTYSWALAGYSPALDTSKCRAAANGLRQQCSRQMYKDYRYGWCKMHWDDSEFRAVREDYSHRVYGRFPAPDV